MDSSRTVDIIIPTFRLQNEYLLPLIQLPKPAGWLFRYFLVVDNPLVTISNEIKEITASHDVTLLINQQNLGASASRNKGMNAGKGRWILFLDDDIQADEALLFHYTEAIHRYPNEIGFIGLVVLPLATTNFAKAQLINGSISIFGIAEEKEAFAWGATANMLVSRQAVGNIQFSNAYPKSGGGEDVDFFLNVKRRNQSRDYKTLKEAKVYHPWWGGGKPDFKRPFRHGVGNSYLGELNPQYTYYDFPNTPEAIFLLLLTLPFALMPVFSSTWAVKLLIIVIVGECLSTIVQLIKRREGLNIPIIWYVLSLKLAHQAGLLWGNISRFRLKGIGERFVYNGQIPGNGFFRFNTYKMAKWVLYLMLGLWLFC